MSDRKIKVAIVDDKQEFIDELEEMLSFYSDITICGTATKYRQAKKLLIESKPDLVFLDVEMPCRDGFELLNETRQEGADFSVIFYTAFDKYVIKALRESAFDFIVKPVRPDELKKAVERFKEHHAKQSEKEMPLFQGISGTPEIMTLPTHTGIRFLNVNNILMFRSAKTGLLEKSVWEVVLADESTVRLTSGLSAERILKMVFKERFLQINQSCIVNLFYLNMVEFKTHKCLLVPPFHKLDLQVSRNHLNLLKEKFDKL